MWSVGSSFTLLVYSYLMTVTLKRKCWHTYVCICTKERGPSPHNGHAEYLLLTWQTFEDENPSNIVVRRKSVFELWDGCWSSVRKSWKVRWCPRLDGSWCLFRLEDLYVRSHFWHFLPPPKNGLSLICPEHLKANSWKNYTRRSFNHMIMFTLITLQT